MDRQERKENYARRMDEAIAAYRDKHPGRAPRLLLHVCCAPCSSHCLELLRDIFDVTVLYYNPNITAQAEYERRLGELKRLIGIYNGQVRSGSFDGMRSDSGREIDISPAAYDPETFLRMASGLEDSPEGGERCMRCYALRLGYTAQAAADGGYDFFTTTLTISPHKSAAALNRIGLEEGERHDIAFLPSDFKKRDGYKRSVELSARFGLYRQDYCGCVYSRRDRKEQ